VPHDHDVACGRAAGIFKSDRPHGIEATNEPSLRLHAKLNFTKVGHLRSVGRKFDKWLDLVFMQLMLEEETSK